MGDDDLNNDLGFDPTMKKKKKKKTKFQDDDEGEKAETKEEAPAPQEEEAPTVADVTVDLEDLTFEGKKKKKKKAKAEGEEEEKKDEAPEPTPDVLDDGEFTGMKKKKKKKADASADADGVGAQGGEEKAAQSDEKDYSYEELLGRVFSVMKARNPDAGEKRPITLKPPQVARVGTKKTSFVNFTEISKLLHRQADHLQAFLLAELSTSGSVDGSDALVIKGRFQQRDIESVLRKYIREYVSCHTCKSPDTILAKENRLFFLQCETCGSKCSVANIKQGFQALTSKRAVTRAKET